MKLRNIQQIEQFLFAVKQTNGDVWIESIYGDKFSLKSSISQYIALSALLGKHGDEFELFCSKKEDEKYFLKFFKQNPEVL